MARAAVVGRPKRMLATCGLADLQALIETIGADVFVVDVLPDGSFLSATHNSRLQRSTGMDIKAAQGKRLAEFMEKSELNGQTYLVQYFERAVFEYHPENQPPYDVLLSQLGTFQYREKYGAR